MSANTWKVKPLRRMTSEERNGESSDKGLRISTEKIQHLNMRGVSKGDRERIAEKILHHLN